MNYKYYTAAGLIVLAFATGRFLTPVKIETKTIEVERKQTETDRDKHKDTTTTTTEKPDGTKVTETHTTEDTTTQRSTTDATRTDTNTTKTYASGRTSIFALAGLDISARSVVYGGLITRQLIGPLSIGAWGLTNGTVGVSLGLEF